MIFRERQHDGDAFAVRIYEIAFVDTRVIFTSRFGGGARTLACKGASHISSPLV